MEKKLSQPPPKLCRVFEVIYWSLIGLTALIVVVFVLLLILLAVALLVGWLASLML